MVRTTLGAEVATTVTVSGSESVGFLNLDRLGTVSDGDTETVVVRPPAGNIYELLTVRIIIDSPNGNNSDSHSFDLRSESETISVLRGASAGDKRIVYTRSHLDEATESKLPPSVDAQVAAPRGVRADDSNGYQIRYDNDSGADQTSSRQYRFWVREIQVSE